MRRVLTVGLFTSLVAAAATRAADIPVAGTRVQIRTHGTRAKLVFTSKDAGWTLPYAPSAGTPGPVQIDVLSPAHPTPVSLVVPQIGGKPGWTVSINGQGAARRYRFKNPSAPDGFSAIDSVVWSTGSFKLIVRDALLDPSVPQGGFSIRVADFVGRQCARFDAGTITRDVPGSFNARNAPASALADCSAAALGGVTCDKASPGTCGGTCEGDAQCTFFAFAGSDGYGLCLCAGGSNLACGDSYPVCNGFCPAGMHCGGLDPIDPLGRSCGCVPDGTTACGEADYPTCGGACPDPNEVCRPTSRTYSVFFTSTGCECNPVGGCTVGDGTPGDIQMCGPGADCPAGTICSSQVGQPGCYAGCGAP